MKQPSTLFACAHDGKLFYKAVMKRLSKFPDTPLIELCRMAGIEFTTAWRWNRGSKPETPTINAIERALNKLERGAHTTSSTSGIKPKARR